MTVLLDHAGIAALVPHAGSMCLWQELLAADDGGVHLRSKGHRDPLHPLRHADRLAALHLIEYGAQAMAVHGGWLARGGSVQAGVLAAVRDVELHVERVDDLALPLECVAQRLVSGEGGEMYRFRLFAGLQTLATGRASVIHAS